MKDITLRKFTESEYHLFFRQYQPDLQFNPPFEYNREMISRSYRYNHGGFQPDYIHLGVFEDDMPVGSFQLKRMDPEKKTFEFGIILLNESCRGRGIGPKAIDLGLQLAQRQYAMETAIADTMGNNERMKRVFFKLGFELIETVPNAFTLWNGEKEDRLIYRKKLQECQEESDG